MVEKIKLHRFCCNKLERTKKTKKSKNKKTKNTKKSKITKIKKQKNKKQLGYHPIFEYFFFTGHKERDNA